MKPPPRRVPTRLRSSRDVRALQRLMLHALVQPLTARDRLAPRWPDGRKAAAVAAEFIKPNDRLGAAERLQIYARCYWYRLLDCVYDDSPGLRALLGARKFAALARAYLAKYPSRSFTLRNLCARLPQFILEEPRFTAPSTALAHAVARFEWAQTVAFDGAALPGLTPADLAGTPAGRLRLALQPYLSLLALDWPVDDYVIAVKQRESLRGAASNAVEHAPRTAAPRRVPHPRRGPIRVVVHRYENRVYYKRVDAAAFDLLESLAAGRTLARALGALRQAVPPEQVRTWFATWTELGWLCRPE